jgi:Enoyl-CoA hydratase/carnithine racemase
VAENIRWEVENEIGILTIQRPSALNALNYDTMIEIEEVMDKVALDSSIKVVIITGEGEKSFVAGADIAYMQNLSAVEGYKWGEIGQRVFQKVEDLPQPVIAAVNGFALGGGCELAMACDIRFASDNAKFGQPEVTLGITAGFGGTQRLPRLVGKGRAKELLFTGMMISAEEAYRIGLVNKVFSQSELMNEAKIFANKTSQIAPIAVQATKMAVNRGMDMDLRSGIAFEASLFGMTFSTEDQSEGMSAFLEKRKADFKGK